MIGFDAKRGDSISVQNMSFDTSAEADVASPNWIQKLEKTLTDYSSLLRPVSLLVLFLLAYMFVVRPIQTQALKPALPGTAAQPALVAAANKERLQGAQSEPADGTQRATQLKQQAIDITKQKPANSARAIQAWLREEPS